MGRRVTQVRLLEGACIQNFRLNLGPVAKRKDVPRIEMELEADYFAGCAVARLGDDFDKPEDLLARRGEPNIPGSADEYRAREGFDECRLIPSGLETCDGANSASTT